MQTVYIILKMYNTTYKDQTSNPVFVGLLLHGQIFIKIGKC